LDNVDVVLAEQYTIYSEVEDYPSATNLYSQVNPLGKERNQPLYVLVFGDEEERPELRLRPTIIGPEWCNWTQWAGFNYNKKCFRV